MFWKLILILGVFTKIAVSSEHGNTTPEPDKMAAPKQRIKSCFNDLACARDEPRTCKNTTDFDFEVKSYIEAAKTILNKTRTAVVEFTNLVKFAVTRVNYTNVVAKMRCMDLTNAKKNCSHHLGTLKQNSTSNSTSSEVHKKDIFFYLLLLNNVVYKQSSCTTAGKMKDCVIEEGLKICDDEVKMWAAGLFDYSIGRCNMSIKKTPNSASGKFSLPSLTAFMVTTIAIVSLTVGTVTSFGLI